MSAQKELYHAIELTGDIESEILSEVVASSEYDELTGSIEFRLPDGSTIAICMDYAPACDMTVYWTRPGPAK